MIIYKTNIVPKITGKPVGFPVTLLIVAAAVSIPFIDYAYLERRRSL